MTEKELKCVSHRMMGGVSCGPDVFVYSNGQVNVSTYGAPITITMRLSREDAMKLANNIIDAIADYDAGRDEYVGDE